MKVCKACCTKGDTQYCPNCGQLMRFILTEQNSEIFVPSYSKDNIIGVGWHVGCGGIVELNSTSGSGSAYSCRRCYLRIIHER